MIAATWKGVTAFSFVDWDDDTVLEGLRIVSRSRMQFITQVNHWVIISPPRFRCSDWMLSCISDIWWWQLLPLWQFGCQTQSPHFGKRYHVKLGCHYQQLSYIIFITSQSSQFNKVLLPAQQQFLRVGNKTSFCEELCAFSSFCSR